MKFNSTYDVLRYLISQNIEFSFSSQFLNHGQMATIRVTENIKKLFDAASIFNMECVIFEFMRNRMADDPLYWIEDFKVSPTMAGDGSLVFEVEYFSCGKYCLEEPDPLYALFVWGFPGELGDLFAYEYADTPLRLDMLRLFLDIKIVGSTFEKLGLSIVLADDCSEELNKSELARVNVIVSEIKKSAISTLKAGVKELAREVNGSGVSSYYVEIQTEDEDLSEPNMYANYFSCYTTQFSGACIDYLRTDELLYEVL